MQDKKQRLKEVLRQKRGERFYADLLGVTKQQIKLWKKEIRDEEEIGTAEAVEQKFTGSSIQHDLEKGTIKYEVYYDHPPSQDEVLRDHNIDTERYQLSAYYSKGKNSGWLVTALFRLKSPEEEATQSFQEFLKSYKPSYRPVDRNDKRYPDTPGSLIINKQDAHMDKKCMAGGSNSILDRGEEYLEEVGKTIVRAESLCDLDTIIYIVGSDHFNSEVTGATVKGTMQVNVGDYFSSFESICNHEVQVISRLLASSDNVEVIYLIGNHDLCVSYHMASWLQAYFRNEMRLKFDIRPEFTKYFCLYDTAVCINHSDVQKPEKLAQNFPIEFNHGFATSEHRIILAGDKHSELTRDIGGIKFYQIPAISKAKGTWDKQMGYTTTKAQITSFLIEPGQGVSTIIKRTL